MTTYCVDACAELQQEHDQNRDVDPFVVGLDVHLGEGEVEGDRGAHEEGEEPEDQEDRNLRETCWSQHTFFFFFFFVVVVQREREREREYRVHSHFPSGCRCTPSTTELAPPTATRIGPPSGSRPGRSRSGQTRTARFLGERGKRRVSVLANRLGGAKAVEGRGLPCTR